MLFIVDQNEQNSFIQKKVNETIKDISSFNSQNTKEFNTKIMEEVLMQ